MVKIACWIAMLLIVGCSNPAPEARGSASPREQVILMYRAILNEDRESFLSSFESHSSEVADVLSQFFNCATEVVALKKAILDGYGPEAWEEFLSFSGEGAFLTNIPVCSSEELKRIEDGLLELHENGSGAEITLEGFQDPVQLTKRDGAWFVLPESLILDSVPPRTMASIFSRQHAAFQTARDRAEKKSHTLREINSDLAVACFNSLANN